MAFGDPEDILHDKLVEIADSLAEFKIKLISTIGKEDPIEERIKHLQEEVHSVALDLKEFLEVDE